MIYKSDHRKRRQMRFLKLFPVFLLLISLPLTSFALASDPDASPLPVYDDEAEQTEELSEDGKCEESEDAHSSIEPEETEEETANDTDEIPEEIPEENENITDIPEISEDEEDEEELESMSLLAAAPIAFSDSAEDPNYITVEKRFTGLSAEQIPAAFQISVASGTDTYILNGENTADKSVDADGTVIWSWRIVGVGTGTYSVSEANEALDGYSVTKSGEGTVTVRATDIAVYVPAHETTCSHVNWPVKVDGDSNVLFAATLTQGGVAVISKTPLSASRRAAVSAAVLKINGPWKTPVYFYSIQQQLQSGTGFELNGATITYDPSTEEVIIGRTRNWQHVATVTYSVSEASNPEIALVNTYERSVRDVSISKTVSGTMGDHYKSFDFAVTVTLGGNDADFIINGAQYTGFAGFSLKNGENIVLHDVPIGAELTVTEADYSGSGYSASCSVNGQTHVGGRSAELEVSAASENTVHFTNTKDAAPDTGVTLDSFPYILILCAVTLFTAMLLHRKETG